MYLAARKAAEYGRSCAARYCNVQAHNCYLTRGLKE